MANNSASTGSAYLTEKCATELSILLLWFNKIFGNWTLVWQATFISVLVIDITIAVLNQSVRALLVAGCIGTMMVYLYTKMGEVFEESQGIHAWLPWRHDPWLKKCCEAYRALRVNVGSFYYADRGLIFTMLAIMLQNTSNLVLTLRGR